MAYKVAVTNIPGDSFRPWNSRLGIYTPNEFVIPTWSGGRFQRQDYTFMDPQSMMTRPRSSAATVVAQGAPPVVVVSPPKKAAGMGDIDLSSLTSNPLVLLGAAAAAYYFFFRK